MEKIGFYSNKTNNPIAHVEKIGCFPPLEGGVGVVGPNQMNM